MQQPADQVCGFFQSVTAEFTPLTEEDQFTPPRCDLSVLDGYSISVTNVERELMRVGTDIAVGPERIPNWVLRECACFLSGPVCALSYSSLHDGYLHRLWTSSNIVPLPKVTPQTQIQKDLAEAHLFNTSAVKVAGDVLESVDNTIAGHHIDSCTYGSIKQSSTVHAVVDMIRSWSKALDSRGNMVQILLLDFSKAFDCRVDHTIPLNRMSTLGLPGFLLQWITRFLTNRRMRVKVGNSESEWRQVNAGVPLECLGALS